MQTAYLLDLSVKGVEIDKQVNARIRKRIHAASVVGSGIDMVDSDAVDAQLGHASDVAFALIRVNERVIGDELIGDA